MIASLWNYLEVGHRVMVHEPPFPPEAPIAGNVVRVNRKRGANEVAVRLTDGRLVWPALTTVHVRLPAGDKSCWRCRDLAAPMPIAVIASPRNEEWGALGLMQR